MLPRGTNLKTAASGFKNQGQFIAALHVSKNLNIPFNELKARMTGPNAMSLGQAVHVLRPNTPERQAHQEAKLAEKQAKETEKAKPNRSPRNQQPPEAQKLHAFAPLLPGWASQKSSSCSIICDIYPV